MEQIEHFSQAGMEACCIRFNDRINSEIDERGKSFNANMHGKYIRCSYQEKKLWLVFDVLPEMRNPAGVMHGGAAAGAIDITMGSLSYFWSGGFLTPTISLTTNYERPIPTGCRLIVEATCLSCGKTMAYLSAVAWVEGKEEKIVLSGTGTYYTASGVR